METQKSLVRIQHSWLASNERVLLVYIAKRLPAWIRPDHLTAFGLAGALLCGIGFAAAAASPRWLWLAVAGLVVNWAGDSLDGNLARARGIERPRYGFFVDHSCDVVSQALIFMGLAVSPYIRFESGCLLLMSYWIASMYTFIRAIAVQVFQISYFGIGPTEIRIGLIFYVLSLLTVGRLPVSTSLGVLSLMDLLAMAIFGSVCLSFLVMTLWEARRLAALEISAARARAGAVATPGKISLALLDQAVPLTRQAGS
jgi:phosphatidylglycerophosphate synthase